MAGQEARWSAYQLIIALVMVSSGSINTLAAKWADQMEARGTGTLRNFDHPFVQAVCMFIGEFLCLPVFYAVHFIRKWQWNRKSDLERDLGSPVETAREMENRQPSPFRESRGPPPSIPRFNPLVFLPASLCDMTATSIMYIGLNLTNAASFQMLRGAVIIFTGLLSVAFLRSVLRCYKWTGMFLVVVGLVIVGLADILFGENKNSDLNGVISGDLLIIMAQVIVAIQMVYEQKFVMKYDVPPLMAVGFEGLFGMTLLSIMLVPMYYIRPVPETFSDDPNHRLENPLEAFTQMGQNPLIIVALMGTIVSIAFFNFAGITVTKELSATTRMILDSVRTIVIWLFSLLFFKQQFVALQLLGFVFLIAGMFVYNDLIFGPLFRNSFLAFLDRRGWSIPALNRCCMPDLQPADENNLVVPADEDQEFAQPEV